MAIQEKKSDVQEDELDLTPMIDVVFLLLVFFMVATKAKLANRALDAFLPKDIGGKSDKTDTSDTIKIELKYTHSKARIFVNKIPVSTYDGLFQKLRNLTAIMQEAPVIIAPEGGVKFKYVVLTLNACARAEVKKVAFSQPSKVRQ